MTRITYHLTTTRKVLGVLGREMKDCETDKPVLTFQTLAEQLGYGDRRDVHNFHRDLRASDFDVQAFVTRKATKHDRLFVLVEAAVLETPLLGLHEQYLSFCAEHPAESLSDTTFRKYVTEMDGGKLVRRLQQVVNSATATLDQSRYLREVLAHDRLSHAKKKEIAALLPDRDREAGSAPAPAKQVEYTAPRMQQKLLVVVLFACHVSQDVLALLMGVSKSSIHYWITGHTAALELMIASKSRYSEAFSRYSVSIYRRIFLRPARTTSFS